MSIVLAQQLEDIQEDLYDVDVQHHRCCCVFIQTQLVSSAAEDKLGIHDQIDAE